jgi:hypothetical protein
MIPLRLALQRRCGGSVAGDVYRCAPTGVSWAGTGGFLDDEPIPTPHQAATQFDVLGVMADGLHTFDTWFSVPR